MIVLMNRFLFLVGLLLCLAFNAVAQDKEVEAGIPTADPDSLEMQYYAQLTGLELSDSSSLSLYREVFNWYGTPYRFGGHTKRGIDCSYFANELLGAMYLTPNLGNSRSLYEQSEEIPRDELKEGDILFFKIRRGQISHVGVYLGNDKFVHASSSSGVMISDLNDDYYRRYFYKAGRIVFDRDQVGSFTN